MRIRAMVATLISTASIVIFFQVPAEAAPAPAAACAPTDPTGAPVVVTAADDSRTVCLLRGQRLSVRLSVDPDVFPDPRNWWTPIQSTGTALRALPMIELVRRGVTAANYLAVARGTDELTSTRSPCARSGEVSCALIVLWRLTVTVASGPVLPTTPAEALNETATG